MRKMKKKLSSEKGETILETLVALLIIVLSISFLSAAIAKSASISNEIKKATEDGFTYNADPETQGTQKRISSTGDYVIRREGKVSVFEVSTEAGNPKAEKFYYYEP